MSLSAAVIRELINAGLEGEALVGACERIEAANVQNVQTVQAVQIVQDEQAERRRAKDRERKATLRNSAEFCGKSDAPQSPLTLDKENPPHPPKKLNPNPPIPPTSPARGDAFNQFWAAYPHKVGKADAKAKFDKALKAVDLETLMAGLARYAAKTDDRPWCNPATWLHQQRWGDEPAQQPRGSPLGRESIQDRNRRIMMEISDGNQRTTDLRGNAPGIGYLPAPSRVEN